MSPSLLSTVLIAPERGLTTATVAANSLRIAWLQSCRLVKAAADKDLIERARAVAAAGWQIDLLCVGNDGPVPELPPGVKLHALGPAELSRELPAALAQASIVHLWNPAERSAALALLIARLQGKPVCATDPGPTPGGLWESLHLHRLVPQIVPPHSTAHRLVEIYRQLLPQPVEVTA